MTNGAVVVCVHEHGVVLGDGGEFLANFEGFASRGELAGGGL